MRICPRCGSAAVPIAYGLPAPSMFEAASAGEIQLGGCTVTDDDPDLACTNQECRLWYYSDQPWRDGIRREDFRALLMGD